MLPGIDGLNICKKLRNEKDVPILIVSAWGEDSYGDVTTITVHIRKIREKIENDPSHPDYIDTV